MINNNIAINHPLTHLVLLIHSPLQHSSNHIMLAAHGPEKYRVLTLHPLTHGFSLSQSSTSHLHAVSCIFSVSRLLSH